MVWMSTVDFGYPGHTVAQSDDVQLALLLYEKGSAFEEAGVMVGKSRED